MVKNRRSSAQSRTAVFRAAAAEFSERGYEGAGVDRIAARARVNKAMIYYHFGSKRGVYLAILRDMFLEVGARARGIADADATAPEKLDRWILAIIEEATARPWFPPIMLREVASGGPHLDPETLGMMNAVFDTIRDVVAQGQREGVFRADADPVLTHLTILPSILIFLVRLRLIAGNKAARGLFAPRQMDDFVRHMQVSARGMLRKD